jgi:hypothetical protein
VLATEGTDSLGSAILPGGGARSGALSARQGKQTNEKGKHMKIQSKSMMKTKRFHPGSKNPGIRKMAGTVSAAALMLGASQAATVGFNFQVNYCYAAAYSGAVVTASAFGIGPASWESLSPMDTGYGCPPGYYTLSETINTTSSGGGLNPLPNGSVTVTWSAYTANTSALFGGYQLSPPNYSISVYDGYSQLNNYLQPGNEQVYWGFLRDGVNFGPGSTDGNNDQPGYVIDITGLKSLFPHTPFAVELIASSDSMQYLANAFIIDATAHNVQSVNYPSTPPVLDVGVPPFIPTPWVRGIGGGLSTASDALNTDHLQIIGNRAAHGGNKATGFSYNFASTIAGFIITDKPVVSMSPQSVTAFSTDSVTLSGYAVGVPPLSYQWYKNGAPIYGANDASYTFRANPWDAGNYTLVVGNRYGQATSDPSAVTINPPPTGHKPAKVISNPYLM